MDDDKAVGGAEFVAMAPEFRRQDGGGGDFRGGQGGGESLGAEVVGRDGRAVGLGGVAAGAGEGVVETGGAGMGEQDQEVHGRSSSASVKRAFFQVPRRALRVSPKRSNSQKDSRPALERLPAQ